jgi:hypothetical protein
MLLLFLLAVFASHASGDIRENAQRIPFFLVLSAIFFFA